MNKNKKTLTALTATAAVAALGVTTTTAHADETTPATTQAQTSTQDQLAQKQADNQKQIADQTAANQSAENQLAAEIASQNAQTTKDAQTKIDAINAKLNQENAQQADADAQDLANFTKQTNATASQQTAKENDQYNANVNATKQANQTALQKQTDANNTELKNAANLVVTPEQKAQQVSAAQQAQTKAETTVNDTFNTDMANAKRTKDNAINQATTNRDQGLKNANAQKQSAIQVQQAQNTQNLAAANHAYDQAVANAPKITNAVKPATPAGMDQLSPAGKMSTSDEDHQMYPVATMGSWYNINTEDGEFNTNANVVSNENQLPLDFKPGILAYDPANDHSEKINGNLTDAQKQRLNDLSNQWMNSLRHQVWEQMKIQNSMPNAHVDGYSSGREAMTVAELAPQGQLQDLITPKNYWNHVSTVIGQTREQHHTGYEHSVKNAKNGAGYDDNGGSYIGKIQEFDANDSANPDVDAMNAYAENLYSVEGNTMLQFEVNLYNRMQDNLWGEFFSAISNTDNTPHLGGHLANVLNPNFKLVGMGFQNAKTDPDFDVRTTGSDNQNETFYYVVWDFGGDTDGHTDQEYRNTYAQWMSPDTQEGLVNTDVIDAIKSAQSDKDAKPDLNAPAVKAAAAHVDQVKADNQHALDAINAKDFQADVLAAYNTAIKQANDTYTAQVNTLTKNRDAKLQSIKDEYAKQIADIKAQPESLAALQQQLNAKLDAIKEDGQAKLAALQKAHEDALAKITANAQSAIADYKNGLEAKTSKANAQRKASTDADIKVITDKRDTTISDNNARLTTLKSDNAKALSELQTKLSGEYTALDNKLNPAPAKATTANAKQVIAGHANKLVMTNTDSQVNLPTSNVHMTSTSSEIKSESEAKKADTKANQLPQTGNKSSLAVAAFGAVAAMFGLGIARKKQY